VAKKQGNKKTTKKKSVRNGSVEGSELPQDPNITEGLSQDSAEPKNGRAELPQSRIPNADTLISMSQFKAGNLTRYDDADDLFKKLGIKVGKK
jgi:hypothetical protein